MPGVLAYLLCTFARSLIIQVYSGSRGDREGSSFRLEIQSSTVVVTNLERSPGSSFAVSDDFSSTLYRYGTGSLLIIAIMIMWWYLYRTVLYQYSTGTISRLALRGVAVCLPTDKSYWNSPIPKCETSGTTTP